MGQDYRKGSEFWGRRKKNIQSDFVCRPQAIQLLGNIKGLRVVDLGCGEGYVSRILSDLGAIVTGVDNELKMIDSAIRQERVLGQGIDYYVGDVTNLSSVLEANSYDKAVSINVAPHLTYEQMKKSFEEANRILKVGGDFILAVPHPRVWTDKLKTKWMEYGYEDFIFRPDVAIPVALLGGDGGRFPAEGYFYQYPHCEQEIENLLSESGFDILEKIEPLATEEDMKTFPEKWGVESKAPFYLIYLCKNHKK